jgi:glutathione S-transferase
LPVLYVFAISHYCEKIRWALDYKRVKYQLVTLLPGPHRLQLPRGAKRTHLPIWVEPGLIIQDSTEILDHLERQYPERPLTPQASTEREQTLSWEQHLAAELGDPARRLLYSYALNDSRFLLPLYTQDGPWWGRAFYALAMNVVLRAVKGMYEITPEAVAGDIAKLHTVFRRLDARLSEHEFLVGNAFTRADLTLAALAAPLLRPSGHPVKWPTLAQMPPAMLQLSEPFEASPTARRVRQWYSTLR